MLPVILFLVNDDAAVNQNVIEEEDLAWFRFLAAYLGQDSFANKNTPGYSKRLS